MKCAFRFRLNHLGSIWYTAFALILQLYLLYLAFERYHLYTEMKWPLGQYPRHWLTVYVSLLAACIPLMVLFASFGFFKSGNLAGDHDQLGARMERIIECSRCRKRNGLNDIQSRSPAILCECCYPCCHLMRSLWQHSPPAAQSIHLALAIIQLIAQQLMLAQLYRFGFINSGDFLNTELDFVFQRARQLATNLPMGDTRLQGFRITSEELADSPLAPNLLPILMHARLFGVPLEFVNLLAALFAYSIAYPSVYWRVSRAFASCFSFYLLIHSATLVGSYLAWTVLFRVQETNYYAARPVGIGQHLWVLRPDWIALYHPLSLLTLFVVCVVLMQIAPAMLYAYGHSKYRAQCVQHRAAATSRGPKNSFVATQETGIDAANGEVLPSVRTGANSSTMLTRRESNADARVGVASEVDTASYCCDGYVPHVSAIALLILVVLAKAPSLYALMILYQHEEKILLLTCICLDVAYLFSWIVLWLALTIKRDWKFRVWLGVEELLSLQNAHRILSNGSGKLGASSSQGGQLKNALVLMHGKRLYVTDDPLEKSSIWRHATNKAGSTSTPTSRSPGGSQLAHSCRPHHNCRHHCGTASSSATLLPLRGGSGRGAGGGDDPLTTLQHVPLAAPPYQIRQSRALMAESSNGEGCFTVNTFGTFQRRHGGECPRPPLYGRNCSNTGALTPQMTPKNTQLNYACTLDRRPPAAAVAACNGFYSTSSPASQRSHLLANNGSGRPSFPSTQLQASATPRLQASSQETYSNIGATPPTSSVHGSLYPQRSWTHGVYSEVPAGQRHPPLPQPADKSWSTWVDNSGDEANGVLNGGRAASALSASRERNRVATYDHHPGHSGQSSLAGQNRWTQSSGREQSRGNTAIDTRNNGSNGFALSSNGNGAYATYDGLIVRSGVGTENGGLRPGLPPQAMHASSAYPASQATTNGGALKGIAPVPKLAAHHPANNLSGNQAPASMLAHVLKEGMEKQGNKGSAQEESRDAGEEATLTRELDEIVQEFATSIV